MTEQTIIDVLFFVLYQSFNCGFIIVFYYNALTPRFPARYVVPLAMMVQLASYVHTGYLPWALRMVIQLALVFGEAVFLFSDTIKKKLLCASILFGATTLLDLVLTHICLRLFGFVSAQMPVKTWDCILQIIVIDSLSAAYYFTILYFWRKKVSRYPLKTMSLFIIFPLSQAISISGYYYVSPMNTDVGEPYTNPFAYISLVMYIFSDIFMLIALRDNARTEELRAQLRDMEHETEMQTLYYENVTRQYAKIREYRHDIRNLVAAAEITMRSGSQEEGLSMLSDLKNRADDLDIPVYCANPIVSAVIWEKRRKCAEKGIEFTLIMSRTEEIPLENADACSVFANLLDNAIREAKTTDSPHISVSCHSEIGMLFLEVRNSTAKQFTTAPKSTKHGDNHGNGLTIVDNIAKKYSGSFRITADGREACAAFTAQLPEVAEPQFQPADP